MCFYREKPMLNRRQTLQHSWAVAGLLGTAGFLPFKAIAYDKTAFEAKSVTAVLKALGASAPVASSTCVVAFAAFSTRKMVARIVLDTFPARETVTVPDSVPSTVSF